MSEDRSEIAKRLIGKILKDNAEGGNKEIKFPEPSEEALRLTETDRPHKRGLVDFPGPSEDTVALLERDDAYRLANLQREFEGAFERGDYKSTIALGEELLRGGNREPGVYIKLGDASLALGDKDKADDNYSYAVLLNRKDVRALYKIAKLKEGDSAIEVYGEIVKINPRESRAFYEMGLLFRAEGNLLKAEESLKSAYSLEPRQETAEALAVTYQEEGDFESAVGVCKRALSEKGDGLDLWVVRAQSLRKLGEVEALLEAYDKILSLNPTNEEARRDRERLLG